MKTTRNDTLFEQIGGSAADVRINHFFRSTNINSQKAKQRIFLSMAFGGPAEYTGKGLKARLKFIW